MDRISELIRIIIITSSVIMALAFALFIPWLRRIKFGQVIREEGPKRHTDKAGTPTMGGIIIILGSIILFILLRSVAIGDSFNWADILLLLSFLGYGIIGFFDDYLIVVRKHNRGISPGIKFLLELGLALLIYLSLLNHGLSNNLNFFGIDIPLSFFYGIFILIVYVSTTNAVNISDGIDGLACGLLVIAYGAFAIIAYQKGEKLVFYFTISVIIALLTFLLFNANPAKIFMGNVGSHALGGGLVGVAILLDMEILLIIIGGVFVWETLTDIIQIIYFKKTKGKRIFLMSPYHHHLELKGYSEWEIDLILWSFALALALVGIVLGVKVF